MKPRTKDTFSVLSSVGTGIELEMQIDPLKMSMQNVYSNYPSMAHAWYLHLSPSVSELFKGKAVSLIF